MSIYDNVPDDQQLSESEGGSGGSGSDAERMGEESEVGPDLRFKIQYPLLISQQGNSHCCSTKG